MPDNFYICQCDNFHIFCGAFGELQFLFVFQLAACIDGIKNLNWSKFIADELHKALLKCKPTRGCLLFYNVSVDAFLLPSLLSFVISLSFCV